MSSEPLSNTVALASLQNELGLFVREEHAAQRESLHRQWAAPIAERVADGRCIDGLEVVGQVARGVWRLRCAGNDSRFREGDFVRLSRGDPVDALGEAIVVSAGDTEIEVKLWTETTERALAPGTKSLCIDEAWIDLEKMYADALDELGKTEHGRERILPLLAGEIRPTLDPQEVESAIEEATTAGFDDRQAEAIGNACGSDLCWLIHGPPGTGKTHVLAQIAARLAARGDRILVTSFTHRAINHALEAIAAKIPDRRMVAKIAPYVDPGLSVQQFETFAECPLAQSGDGYVVGATPFALRSKRLRGVDFDCVIVDEASQVTIPLAVMAMLAGRRFIFAGDDRQLPPVSVTLPPPEAVKMSIFGRLNGRGFDTLLPVTHRLNDQLCRWPSDTFYQSRLRPHPRAAPRRFSPVLRTAEFAGAFAPEDSIVWMAVPHRGASTAAREEVTLVADMLATLAHSGVSWSEVGVVVPFRKQARLLRRNLAGKLGGREAIGGLVIDTVERMQGQERDVIFVSFATSDEQFAWRMKSFLFQRQRLNVAATRARTKLVLVASPALLEFARSQGDDDDAAAFVGLLESATRIEMPLPAVTDESTT